MNFKISIFALGGLLAVGSLREAAPNTTAGESTLRSFGADLLWVRAYAWWERRDVAMTTQTLWQVVRLDPQPLAFWLNGARMMAYDMPVWRGTDNPSGRAAIRRRIDEEQAASAINFLKKAREIHPRSAVLWIEQGNIELNRLHDLSAAAASYRRAAGLSDAPYYAARIHAELLRRAGRKREAYAWLREIYPQLPANNAEAAAPVVLARLRELEAELQLPPEQRYHGETR